MNLQKTINEIRAKLNALEDALSDAVDEAKTDAKDKIAADKQTIKDWLTSDTAQSSRQIDKIVIHSTATTTAQSSIGAAEIDEWHKARGWRKIGYHYVIKRDGTVETGRREYEPGAHAKGHNKRSIGVALVGGARKRGKSETLISDKNFTVAQWRALARVVRELREKYPDAEVCGHRDLKGAKTACPSFDVAEWASRI